MLTFAIPADVGAAVSRDFNGPDTQWQLLDNGVAAQLGTHDCIAGGARNDAGCEHIVLAAPAGQSAQLAIRTDPIAVLDELEVRMWVKVNRPGVQLAARVTLPRSVNQRSRAPATALIRGEQYTRVGHWHQLLLTNVPKRLAEQVRVLRTAPGAAIDPREAFVDAIVLVVPGGPDATEVWTDDLVVDGVIFDQASGVKLAAFNVVGTAPQATNIHLQGDTLTVDGRPILPRAIEWHGEPFQFLAERGFNALQLASPPTADQAVDARRHGLWFLCSPPRPEELARNGLGQDFDRVLAWILPDDVGTADPNYLRRWAELVRQHDPASGRPIITIPESNLAFGNKAVDIVVARHALEGRMTEAEFAQWLASRARLAPSGTPLWLCVPTQFGAAVASQCTALTGQAAPPPSVDDRQLEAMIRRAVADCIRGILFSSESSLAESDVATRRRAARLESINQRLQLVEPWLAGGKVVSRVQSTDPAWSGVLLHVDYARLLVPIHAGRDDTVPSPKLSGAPAGVAFVVPGVPESCQVFQLSLAELQPLPVQRVTGGMRVVCEPTEKTQLLLTEDPHVIASLRQRIVQQGAKVARLERDLAAGDAAAIVDTARRLAPVGIAGDDAVRVAAAANAQLRQVEPLLAAGRTTEARHLISSVRQSLIHVSDAQRESVVPPTDVRITPLSLSYDQLADQAQLIRRLDALHGGDNLLFAGDFEDLGQVTSAGWQHVSYPTPGVTARAELSADRPYHGHYCLELEAIAAAPVRETAHVASAPIWITSPPIPVEKGQIIEITGWTRVDEPVLGSVEGLEIVDSLGGAELALVVDKTSGWQPFQIIRGVPNSDDLRITFALTGLGKAHLDGVMVRRLQQPVARRLSSAGRK